MTLPQQRAVWSRLTAVIADMPLIWAISAALIAGFVLPFAVSVWQENALRREAQLGALARDQARIVETLSIGLATPIWEVRPDIGRPLIETVMTDDRVTAVLVTAPPLPTFLSLSQPERRKGTLLTAEGPVMHRGETIGSVTVEMTTAPVEAELRQRLRQALLTGFGQVALGLALVFIILRHKVLRPVGRLVGEARALAGGNLDRALDWRQGDEIGVLGRSFENTRQSLKRLISDLERSNADLQQREHDLEHQAQILRATLENMSDGISLVDGSLRLRAWNDRFVQIFELPPNLVHQGLSLAELYAFEESRKLFRDAADLPRRLAATLAPGRVHTLQLETNTGRTILFRRRPLRDGGFVTTYADISEQVRAQRAVDDMLRLLEAVMNAVPAVLHVKDREQRYRMVNTHFLETWSLHREEVIGRTVDEVFCDPDRVSKPRLSDEEVLQTGKAIPFRETILTLPNGEMRDALTTKVPLTDAGGAVSHIVTVSVDITERKRAERALVESEQRYRLLVELSPYGVMLHDPARIQFLNPAGCQILGCAGPADVIGRHYLEFVHPDERPLAAERVRRLFEEGADLAPAERRMITGEGRVIDASVAALPFEEQGRRLALVIFRDISERKRAERERQRWLQLFHDAIESIPNGFAVFDAGNSLLVCNSAFAEPYGMDPARLAGMTISQLRPKFQAQIETLNGRPAADAVPDLFEKLERHAFDDIGPIQIKRHDGRAALINYYPSAEGGIVVVRTDISYLVRMQEALRESEEFYRLLVDVAPYGIILHDDCAIVHINPAGCRLLGASAARDVIGQSWVQFVVPSEKKASMERIYAMIYGSEDIDTTERRLLTLDGREVTVMTSARPFRRGDRPLALIIFADITERKRAADEIARQREALHQAEKMSALGSLLAGVAHELNNPLSVVVGRAMMLEEMAPDPRVADGVRKIREAAERCARTVKTFLAMARAEKPARVNVDIEAIVRGSLDLLAYGLNSAGVKVVLDAARDLPPVSGDPDQLAQVFNNLITNAKQALLGCDGERLLTIRLRYDGAARSVIATVADNGIGIPETALSRVFDPFFTTKPAGVGTGIGLAVCRGIVEAHGGAIRVDAGEGGRGAVFRLSLPVGSPPSATNDAGDGAPAPASPLSVLIIDDEPEVADMLAELLRAAGHRAAVAADGAGALAAIDASPPDVIVCDLIMPGIDGAGFYRELSARRPRLIDRVIFMTGDTLSLPVKRFLDEADRPVIEKPFVPADVVRAIVEAAAGGRLPGGAARADDRPATPGADG
ncbi:MAG: PAS domain S-box protein [Rhodospirillales bacterium]|nr:PAS domain S-box protein [Rhodospirillales bacterium]